MGRLENALLDSNISRDILEDIAITDSIYYTGTKIYLKDIFGKAQEDYNSSYIIPSGYELDTHITIDKNNNRSHSVYIGRKFLYLVNSENFFNYTAVSIKDGEMYDNWRERRTIVSWLMSRFDNSKNKNMVLDYFENSKDPFIRRFRTDSNIDKFIIFHTNLHSLRKMINDLHEYHLYEPTESKWLN